MTAAKNSEPVELMTARPQLLPFDPAELLAVRMRPAQFASMCKVSRQTVSQWARKGWISVGPDGLVDPVAATRQLLKRADPARVRARIFREATATHGELRARVHELEAELALERARAAGCEAAARNVALDASAEAFARFTAALVARFDEACVALVAGDLGAWVDELAAVEFYGQSLAEYREGMTPGAGTCGG